MVRIPCPVCQFGLWAFMIRSRLSETFYFFGQHWRSLLQVALPVLLPASLFINYRFYMVHKADPEVAMGDLLSLVVQILAGLYVNALVIGRTLEQSGISRGQPGSERADAADRLPALVVVQLLSGILVFLGLLLFIIPGIWLMGIFMPACVLVVAERASGVNAMRMAWARFRPAAWQIAGTLVVLITGLTLAMLVLAVVEQAVASQGLVMRWLAGTFADVAGLFLTQTIVILLVRFYDLEQGVQGREDMT